MYNEDALRDRCDVNIEYFLINGYASFREQTQLLSIPRRGVEQIQSNDSRFVVCINACTRMYVECAFTRPCTYISLEIRKEAGHEQWLAALRNNVVFVGSFYLPTAQECSLQSASKFIPVLRNAIGSSEYFMFVRFLHENFKDAY